MLPTNDRHTNIITWPSSAAGWKNTVLKLQWVIIVKTQFEVDPISLKSKCVNRPQLKFSEVADLTRLLGER